MRTLTNSEMRLVAGGLQRQPEEWEENRFPRLDDDEEAEERRQEEAETRRREDRQSDLDQDSADLLNRLIAVTSHAVSTCAAQGDKVEDVNASDGSFSCKDKDGG